MTRSPTEALLIAISQAQGPSNFCESTSRLARIVHVIAPPEKKIVIPNRMVNSIAGLPQTGDGLRAAFSEIANVWQISPENADIRLASNGGLFPASDVVISATSLDILKYMKDMARREVEALSSLTLVK